MTKDMFSVGDIVYHSHRNGYFVITKIGTFTAFCDSLYDPTDTGYLISYGLLKLDPFLNEVKKYGS